MSVVPMNPPRPAPLRAVIIDDQPTIRTALAAMLGAEPDLKVVGMAQDGEEGLRVVFQTQPDVVLLDLEMPRMDGFAFLRLLMAKRPTPVIVVSSNNTRESVFRALELGALEFVSKPTRTPFELGAESAERRAFFGVEQGVRSMDPIRDELLAKVRLARRLQMVPLLERTRDHRDRLAQTAQTRAPATRRSSDPGRGPAVPERLVCIGASTGGPAAILSLLLSLDQTLPVGVLVTQHMPEAFTHAFAERLGRATRWTVREAAPDDPVRTGAVLVAAGSFSLRVASGEVGGPLRVLPPSPDESRSTGFVPSVDRMLEAAAQAAGPAVIAVILTGMSGEGVRGAQAVRAAGGVVLVEEPGSAVLAGMPEEVIRAGFADEIVPLPRMADAIARMLQRRIHDSGPRLR